MILQIWLLKSQSTNIQIKILFFHHHHRMPYIYIICIICGNYILENIFYYNLTFELRSYLIYFDKFILGNSADGDSLSSLSIYFCDASCTLKGNNAVVAGGCRTWSSENVRQRLLPEARWGYGGPVVYPGIANSVRTPK